MATLGAGGAFTYMWAYIITCKSVVCSRDKSWYDSLVIRCPMPTWLAVSEVCSTFIHALSIPRLFTLLFSRCVVSRHPRGSPAPFAMACEVTLEPENHGPFGFLDQRFG